MKKNYAFISQTVGFFLVIILSSLFFLLLHNFDNKYTYFSPQAISGTLYIENDDYEKYPLRFLNAGWIFYPNVLLTPEQLEQKEPEYQRHITVGQYTNFSLNNELQSPHGFGTYVMKLRLPQEKRSYSIELPEIFSAYKFYINDKQILQTGNPEPYNYKDLIHTRLVTFEASGKTTLMIAVADFSHFYSGMIYPPAFGETAHVETARGIRMGLSLVATTVALLTALLSFYLALKTRQCNKNAGLFALLCLSLCGYTSYSVVHFLPLSVHPWYTAELFSSYFMTFLVLLLHNRICGITGKVSGISSFISGIFCVVALVYGTFSAELTFGVIRDFSTAVFIFKAAVSAYLLITAWITLQKNAGLTKLLFYATVVYASAFVWDRLMPVYEPIYGWYFGVWGGFAIVFALGTLLWKEITEGYRLSFVFAEERRQMEKQLAIQVEHLRQISEKVEESQRIKHDIRHHLRTLSTLAAKAQQEELIKYLGEVTELNTGTDHIAIAENPELDALLHYYYSLAKEHNIALTFRLELPGEVPFPIAELCTILGNLLENAFEACIRQQDENKFVFIGGKIMGNRIIFAVDNSFDGTLKKHRSLFLSSKRPGPGIGIESVKATVKRYDGIINIKPQGNRFQVELGLPII